jgi:hypothetical protein
MRVGTVASLRSKTSTGRRCRCFTWVFDPWLYSIIYPRISIPCSYLPTSYKVYHEIFQRRTGTISYLPRHATRMSRVVNITSSSIASQGLGSKVKGFRALTLFRHLNGKGRSKALWRGEDFWQMGHDLFQFPCGVSFVWSLLQVRYGTGGKPTSRQGPREPPAGSLLGTSFHRTQASPGSRLGSNHVNRSNHHADFGYMSKTT